MPPNVDGVVAFPHGEGCAHAMGPDVDQLRRTLGGVLVHPNVSAAVILGLGCETNQIDHYLGAGGPRSARLAGLTLQSSGGTTGTIETNYGGKCWLHSREDAFNGETDNIYQVGVEKNIASFFEDIIQNLFLFFLLRLS
jgi:hypothetical protein